MTDNLRNKEYSPREVEKKWYAFWEKEGLFCADDNGSGKKFSIVIPPPNVTGVLHMGHSLNITLQDILCRYHRLLGEDVLWIPGTDHAGIATQNVVERSLAEKNTDRHQIGRERFIAEVWKWRSQYGSAIIHQLKSLGASCDWERERFTMDEGLSRAVRKVFVQLYDEGLIYRGNYIINWCPRCRTALAEIEVEHEELDGHLYHIVYPYPGGKTGPVVATTRPETMLGDTAVAVNPGDQRYANLPSDHVVLPLTGREIPIIRDKYVDMSFGTGALKITPAHDPNDFEIGRRHGLQELKVIDDDGKMTADAGEYAGMDRFKCRSAVVEALSALGLLVKVEDHKHAVGHCYRCHTIVEPNLSLQWFVKTESLAKDAVSAVKTGNIRIIPEKWSKDYYIWMENIRDWCISRQIWWGHRIPAWTCESCGRVIVAVDDPDLCPDCGSESIVQDSDVLDTWFSSALWPFSTMGWPDNTRLLEQFYPTSVLVTGFDILFFWVARMMMMGLHFKGDVPFHDVYVHALVRDEDGKKMSKSTGNVIDPLSIIEKYGTDALRFTLTAFAAQGRDIKLSEKRIEGYRNFINKLWNAARFSFMHLKEAHETFDLDKKSLCLPDKWILSRLKKTIDEVKEALDGYRFNEAAAALYGFVWHEFCDWYLEAVKPALYGKLSEKDRDSALSVLWRVLRDTIILLHPFIPFVTEEIWHSLPGTKGSVMAAAFPGTGRNAALPPRDPDAERDMDIVIGVITVVRNIRGEMNVPPSLALSVIVQSDNDETINKISRHRDIIVNLARLENLTVSIAGEKPGGTATSVVGDAVVSVLLKGVIDFELEINRLEKKMAKIGNQMHGLSKKLSNMDYLKKAPAQVVEKTRANHEELAGELERLSLNLEKIRSMET
ncbi:MAG: valine--tRNA ligase [Deltaproteobacteria bacterium]|nr:valine--tRNA ligase [Deltaproteobacteria bacterium]